MIILILLLLGILLATLAATYGCIKLTIFVNHKYPDWTGDRILNKILNNLHLRNNGYKKGNKRNNKSMPIIHISECEQSSNNIRENNTQTSIVQGTIYNTRDQSGYEHAKTQTKNNNSSSSYLRMGFSSHPDKSSIVDNDHSTKRGLNR